jgi:hypothetical protein
MKHSRRYREEAKMGLSPRGGHTCGCHQPCTCSAKRAAGSGLLFLYCATTRRRARPASMLRCADTGGQVAR